MDNPTEYIPVEEASAILGVTPRQVSRYQDRIRTQRVGNRILYNREDICELAKERGREQEAREAADAYREQKPPPVDVFPLGDVLDYLREKDATIREKDDTIERLHQQLIQAAHRVGELEAQFRMEQERKLLTDQQRKPWWQRLLGVSPKAPPPPREEPSPPQDEPKADTGEQPPGDTSR